MKRLLTDKRGAVAIEMAFALPVTIMLMIGIMQFALVLQASGGMRHGIGEGLRYAKVNPLADPTDKFAVAALKKKVETIAMDSMAGIDREGIQSVVFMSGTDANGAEFGQIDVNYAMKPLIPFAPVGAIKINETRKIYLPS